MEQDRWDKDLRAARDEGREEGQARAAEGAWVEQAPDREVSVCVPSAGRERRTNRECHAFNSCARTAGAR
jgi:hypothetical protein